MTIKKKSRSSHEAAARQGTNKGSDTMKTTKKSHATKATNKGSDTMKTTKKSHATKATNKGSDTMKTTKKKSHAISATNEGDETMKTATKKSHATNATNEGDETMKTTNESHATNATHEGETTMKTTTQISPSETTLPATAPTAAAESIPVAIAAPPAAPTATPTTSPSVAATLAYIQTCTTLMDQLDAAFPEADSLTATDKKRKAKARKGSERYTPQLVALARQHGVNLKLVPLDTISNASAEAAALVPLQKRMEVMSKRAASRTFTLQSTSWSGATKLYAVLKRLSKDSGDVATGLAPVEEFFSHRHPLVAKNHPKTKKGKAARAAEKEAADASLSNAGTTQESAPASAPSAAPAATSTATHT